MLSRAPGVRWTWCLLPIVGLAVLVCPRGTAAQVEVGLDEVTLELDLGGSGDPIFHRIGGIALSGDDELYVSDQFNHSVRVFDLDGRLLRQFGGRGEGPGEFGWAGALQLSDSTVKVHDAELFRVSTFSTDGSLLGTHSSRLTTREESDATGRTLTPHKDLRGGWTLATTTLRLTGLDLETDDLALYVVAVDPTGTLDTLVVRPFPRSSTTRAASPAGPGGASVASSAHRDSGTCRATAWSRCSTRIPGAVGSSVSWRMVRTRPGRSIWGGLRFRWISRAKCERRRGGRARFTANPPMTGRWWCRSTMPSPGTCTSPMAGGSGFITIRNWEEAWHRSEKYGSGGTNPNDGTSSPGVPAESSPPSSCLAGFGCMK